MMYGLTLPNHSAKDLRKKASIPLKISAQQTHIEGFDAAVHASGSNSSLFSFKLSVQQSFRTDLNPQISEGYLVEPKVNI
jgi:hypothetical protein